MRRPRLSASSDTADDIASLLDAGDRPPDYDVLSPAGRGDSSEKDCAESSRTEYLHWVPPFQRRRSDVGRHSRYFRVRSGAFTFWFNYTIRPCRRNSKLNLHDAPSSFRKST